MIGLRIGIKPVPGKQGLAIGPGEDAAAPSVLSTTMSLTLLDSADPVNGNTNFNYTSVVTNTGANTASSVTWTLTLDSSLTFVSGSGTGWTVNNSGHVVTATRASLAPGAAPTITVTVTPTNADATVSSSATATASNVFVAVTPATQTTVINSVTALTAVLADLSDPVMTSANYSYTGLITNTGSAPATNVVATFVCPTNSTFVSASGTGWVCNNSGHTVTCTRASLAVGAGPLITVVVTSAAAAETSSATLDADADNTSPATQDVETTTVLLVAMDATSGKRVPNSAVEWANVSTLLGFTVSPSLMWKLQEASGNFADSIGTFTGTAGGTPGYQQAEAGWTRKGVDFSAVSYIINQDAGLPNTATNSMTMFALVDIYNVNPSTTQSRRIMGLGGPSGSHFAAIEKPANEQQYRINVDGVGGTATATRTGVRPLTLKFDRTGLENVAFTDADKMPLAFQTGVTGKNIIVADALGGAFRCLYLVAFFNANAELTNAQIKLLYELMGWTVGWTP